MVYGVASFFVLPRSHGGLMTGAPADWEGGSANASVLETKFATTAEPARGG